MSVEMKLGWWRDRNGKGHQIIDGGPSKLWRSNKDRTWGYDGSYWCDGTESPYDLIEFIRPLDTELPPTLNYAVKAAEDRVRALGTHHAAAQKLADDALFILEEAKRELERLEKECEVKP